MDRTPLLPGNQQEGLRRGVLCDLPCLPLPRPALESGRRCTIFSDSTAAINRVRSDALGPRQRFAVAVSGVCSKITARDNEVSTRWVPAHCKMAGKKKADEYSKAATSRGAPGEEAPDEYRWQTRTATEARSHTAAEWITDRVRTERSYRAPAGGGFRRKQLTAPGERGGGWLALPAPVRACCNKTDTDE